MLSAPLVFTALEPNVGLESPPSGFEPASSLEAAEEPNENGFASGEPNAGFAAASLPRGLDVRPVNPPEPPSGLSSDAAPRGLLDAPKLNTGAAVAGLAAAPNPENPLKAPAPAEFWIRKTKY